MAFGRILLAASVLLGLWGCASTVADLRGSAPIDSAKFKGNYKRIMECGTAKLPGPNATPLYFEQERRATLTVVSQGEFGRTRGLLEIAISQVADGVVQYELRVGQGVYATKDDAIGSTRKFFSDCSDGVMS